MRCDGLEPGALAWWCGDLAVAEGDAVEEHVFACAPCAAEAEALAALAAGTRALARAGRLHVAVLPSLLERLARDGVRIRTFRIAADGSAPCGVAADDELLVSRLEVPLAGVERIDADFVSEPTGVRARVEDVPFDPAAGAVLLVARAAAARAHPAGPLHYTLFGSGAGGSRCLGTFTLVHDPAGPPPDPVS